LPYSLPMMRALDPVAAAGEVFMVGAMLSYFFAW
jgi:hypothetical protein